MVNNLYFKCLICDKISASKSHCMEHLVRHSNSRPFTCLACGKTYKSRKACREHIMVIHKLSRHQEVEINEKIKVDAVVYQQMKSICTQYEQLYVPEDSSTHVTESKGEDHIGTQLSHPVTQIKEEARPDSPEIIDIPDLPIDPQSPATSSSTPSIPAMPLLVKRPSPASDTPALSFNESREGSVTPPASKRGRKGIPQKVSQPEEEEDLAVEIFCDNIPAFPEPFLKPSTSPILGNASDSNGFSRPKSKTIPPCEICGRQFVTKEKRIDHLRSHSQLKQFSCRVCKRFFKYRRGVTNHLKEVHKYTDRIKISSNVISHENEDNKDKQENGQLTASPSTPSQLGVGLSPGGASASPSGTVASPGGDSGGEVLIEPEFSTGAAMLLEDINSMEVASLNQDEAMDSTNYICMECGEVCDTAEELAQHTKTH